MDKYEELEMEVVEFEDVDVITNSQDWTGESQSIT